MIKYTAILLGLYVVYYAGNIVYDLFFRKEKKIVTDESEEFTLKDITTELSEVYIDDVEEIDTPGEFIQHDFDTVEREENDRPDLDQLREKFEREEEFDFENSLNKATQENVVKKVTEEKNNWKDLMKMSETMVQVVKDYDGQKVYHSTI
ncbi:hypothetical protein [Vaginella massiliensis]|uniref:hypothetical protein n=1 Tax=Vaginella massiliensis TaxID=1816680 RepID=UPI000837C1B4|nr:hypothetical protein [Vaginella massiliensis]